MLNMFLSDLLTQDYLNLLIKEEIEICILFKYSKLLTISADWKLITEHFYT